MELPRPRLGGLSLHASAARTLLALADGRAVSARELAGRLGINDTACHQRLTRLEAHDLVVRRFAPAGTAHRYVFALSQ